MLYIDSTKYKSIEHLNMTMGKNPTSGTCNIKPKKGISRKTIFEVTCQNFKSFVPYEDLHYEFYQCDNTDTLGMNLNIIYIFSIYKCIFPKRKLIKFIRTNYY